ncbi:MAG TPA: SDR family oxidoreductase [Kofleriaceae bacterium]|jgi:NAD(P)-dependent dehydrogenase (short-subunit alcohol dehydrogenase family)|nr:SDR family oxidoreductase [Kofleriaceae bacterium]
MQDQTIALVTGATAGLGKAIAEKLASDGLLVIVLGRDADRGGDVVRGIEARGGHARFVRADLADPKSIERIVAEVAAIGPVDVLVNNAGYAWYGPTATLDAAAFDALFAINVRATYLMVSAFAPAMAERKRGSIVNIGSVLGAITTPHSAAYGATKAAIASLTRSWAAEFAPSGVRVNNVAPGPIEAQGAKGERTAALGKGTLLGRAATNAEIAEAVAFLASPKASYITGTTLLADGGLSVI